MCNNKSCCKRLLNSSRSTCSHTTQVLCCCLPSCGGKNAAEIIQICNSWGFRYIFFSCVPIISSEKWAKVIIEIIQATLLYSEVFCSSVEMILFQLWVVCVCVCEWDGITGYVLNYFQIHNKAKTHVDMCKV